MEPQQPTSNRTGADRHIRRRELRDEDTLMSKPNEGSVPQDPPRATHDPIRQAAEGRRGAVGIRREFGGRSSKASRGVTSPPGSPFTQGGLLDGSSSGG